MIYAIGLIVSLAAFWLGMSGHYTPLLLSLGIVSVMLSVILAARLDILDREGAPYFRFFSVLVYLPWLIVEIIKSNIVVARACLKADLDISPVLVKVRTQCESDLAKTMFANSITLTPGTVTIAVEERRLLVHALYEESAQPEAFLEMDQRSRMAIDGRKAAS
ncbi:MAG: Na+/H+ antiporter subunit E [Pseudomonadota bacterium]